jgi:hypothetical protein
MLPTHLRIALPIQQMLLQSHRLMTICLFKLF